MKKIITLLFSISFLTGYSQDIALQVISPAGGYFESSSAGLSISWTLGEVAYTTLSSDNFILTQGFQQGDLFSTGVSNPELVSSNISLYPNPASSEVKLIINMPNSSNSADVRIYDLTGKMVDYQLVKYENNVAVPLNISNLKPGIFLVKVVIGNSIQKVIKLIKE